MTTTHRITASSALGTAVAAILGLAAPFAQADDVIIDTALGAQDRCAAFSATGLTVRPSRGSARDAAVVWRTGEPSLEIGGGVNDFSAWGNVDQASRITLTGIPGALLAVQHKQGGAANAMRGCGTRGSVSLQVTAPMQPATPVRGRLRFEFPFGAPFDVAVVLQPVPTSLDLRWPGRPAGGNTEVLGEHHDCLRANGGHVRVQGDTLEIGLNPDGPMPQGCDVFSLEVLALGDRRDVRNAKPFLGSGNDRNLGVTRVVGLAAGQSFAQGKSDRLHAMAALIQPTSPAPSAPFAAMQIDYAAAARALTTAPLAAPSAQLAQGLRPAPTGVRRFGTPSTTPVAPAARAIEFQLALDSFNNVTGLHAPMRVRLVNTSQPARSNLVADFSVQPVCSDLNAIVVNDTSTSSLAITGRALRSGDGQTFNAGAGPMAQRIRYAAAGTFNITMDVTDASGFTRNVTRPVSIPRAACNAVAPPNPGGVTLVGNSAPNLLPVRLFPERALLRRIGGLGDNTMVPITFCSTLGNNEAREVDVPELTWGISSAQANAPSARVELRDAAGNAVLSNFDSGPQTANSAAVTRSNYAGRPARVRVVNVTGGDVMVAYGNQAGCFLDKDAAAPRLDPAGFLLVVDSQGAVAEGTDAELDNELRF